MNPHLYEDNKRIEENIRIRRYRVRIPYAHTRSLENIKRRGTPSSGVKAVDRSLASQLVVVMIPICDMVEHYKNGTRIGVCSDADIETIYKDITEYLNYWKERVKYAVNLSVTPVEDLIYYDDFAASVYKHARHQITDDWVKTTFVNSMEKVFGGSVHDFFDRPKVTTVGNVQDDGQTIRINGATPETVDRESFAEFFHEKIQAIRGARRWM